MSTAAFHTWKTEGTAALARRVRHRFNVRRELATFRKTKSPSIAAQRLTVLASLPDPKLGGAIAQCVWRWRLEASREPSALLYPDHRNGRWRLDLADVDQREFVVLGEVRTSSLGLLDPIAPLQEAIAICRADECLIDGIAGFDPHALLAVVAEHPINLYLHDFSWYCFRANLFDPVAQSFCGFSRDPKRCRSCLRASRLPEIRDLDELRNATRQLISQSNRSLFSSDYLRRATERSLDLSLPPPHSTVVSPGIERFEDHGAARPRRRPTRVAFLGGGHAHKGASMIERLLETFEWPKDRWEWHLLGGYGSEGLKRLRRKRARHRLQIHGFYRPGSLPGILVRRGIDVTVQLSLVPETYSLTISESLAAKKPIISSSLGAPSERLPEEWLVEPGDLEGLAERLQCWQDLPTGTLPRVQWIDDTLRELRAALL